MINILYNAARWDSEARLARNAKEKEAAIIAAVDYAGFDLEAVVVDRVEITGIGDDRLGRVDFRYFRFEAADYRRCGMSWCCYVDMNTLEVVGFAGSTERAFLDMEEPA